MRIIKHLICLLLLILIIPRINAQVEGKIELLSDNKTYQVSITPTASITMNLSRTNSAQITLIAPVGGLNISNFQSITGNWEASSSIALSPAENPGFAYYFIELKSPLNEATYTAGEEIILFTFENSADCQGDIGIIDNENDPFIPPNSLNLNVGNLFTVLGYGPINAYAGTTTAEAPCPEKIPATISFNFDELLCHDDRTNLSVEISGGSAPFTIYWTNADNNISDSLIIADSTAVLNDLSAGDYIIELIDNNNLITTDTQIIAAPSAIEVMLEVIPTNCEQSMDGAITISAISGGTGSNYSYDWSNGVSSSNAINNLNQGTYNLTVTDENGCTTTQEAIVEMDGWIDIQLQADDISCFGMSDGALAATATGKNAPFNYQWEGNGVTDTNSNIGNLQAGIYNLTVTDATGVCNQVQTAEIQEPAPITANAIIDRTAFCDLITESTVTISDVVNNRGAVSYSSDGINFTDSNIFTLSAGTTFTLVLQDEAGCTADLEVTTPTPSGLELSLPTELTVRLGDNHEIISNIEAVGNISIDWSPTEGLSCTDCPNPIATPSQTTTYTITVSDDNGCSKEASVIVYLTTTRRVYTPNAFSPNEDGLNDRFTIFTSTDAQSVNSLRIFNRWGEQVYEAPDGFVPGDDRDFGWNGQFNGKNAPTGTYVYFAEITFVDGRTEIFKGEVNLMR